MTYPEFEGLKLIIRGYILSETEKQIYKYQIDNKSKPPLEKEEEIFNEVLNTDIKKYLTPDILRFYKTYKEEIMRLIDPNFLSEV